MVDDKIITHIYVMMLLSEEEMIRDEGGGGPEAGDAPFSPRIHRGLYADPQ